MWEFPPQKNIVDENEMRHSFRSAAVMKVVSWRELSVPQQQLVIAIPALLTFVFINAKVYQEVHSKYIIQKHPSTSQSK